MSQVFALASEFIERMSNPAYGVRVNEDYSLRFAALLSSKGFDRLLRREAARLKDLNTLSPHGWLWLLGWARSRNISLDETLLHDLTENSSSVFMQVAAIDLATRRARWPRHDTIVPLEGFDHRWLSKLMTRCTEVRDDVQTDFEHADTRRSESILIALIQVGSDITLDAASTLLNHPWVGQSKLVRFFWSRCSRLDDETRAIWISRLRPPHEDKSENQ